MKIETIGKGPFVDFSIEGNKIKVGNIQIDCAQLQSDSENIIDICDDGSGNLIVGKRKAFVMNIIIPPKKYQEVQSEDENGEPVLQQQPIPLEPSDITIKLWPYFKNQTN